MGFGLLPKTLSLSSALKLKTSTGSHVGLEGAYFFNPYIGIGGRLAVSTIPVTTTGKKEDLCDPVDMNLGHIGAYFSYPISRCWQIGSKLLGGYNFSTKSVIVPDAIYVKKRFQPGMGTELQYRTLLSRISVFVFSLTTRFRPLHSISNQIAS